MKRSAQIISQGDLKISAAPDDIAGAMSYAEATAGKRPKSTGRTTSITDIEATFGVEIKINRIKLADMRNFSPPDPDLVGHIGPYERIKQAIVNYGRDNGGHEYFAPEIKFNGEPMLDFNLARPILQAIHKAIMQVHCAENKPTHLIGARVLQPTVTTPVTAVSRNETTLDVLSLIKQVKGIPQGPLKQGSQRNTTQPTYLPLTSQERRLSKAKPREYNFKRKYAARIDPSMAWWFDKDVTHYETYIDFVQENMSRVERGEPEMWDPAYINTMEEAEDFWHARGHLRKKGHTPWTSQSLNELNAINEVRKLNNMHLLDYLARFEFVNEYPMYVPYDKDVYPCLAKNPLAVLISDDPEVNGREVKMMSAPRPPLCEALDARPHLALMEEKATEGPTTRRL